MGIFLKLSQKFWLMLYKISQRLPNAQKFIKLLNFSKIIINFDQNLLKISLENFSEIFCIFPSQFLPVFDVSRFESRGQAQGLHQLQAVRQYWRTSLTFVSYRPYVISGPGWSAIANYNFTMVNGYWGTTDSTSLWLPTVLSICRKLGCTEFTRHLG